MRIRNVEIWTWIRQRSKRMFRFQILFHRIFEGNLVQVVISRFFKSTKFPILYVIKKTSSFEMVTNEFFWKATSFLIELNDWYPLVKKCHLETIKPQLQLNWYKKAKWRKNYKILFGWYFQKIILVSWRPTFNGFKMNYEICRCFRSGLGSLNVYSLVFVREIDRKSVLLHLLLKMH